MAKIMISYRRDDSAGWARSLYERLADRFGSTQVFMDVDNIEPGDDFVEAIDREIRSCDIMLALIGKRWLDATDENGNRRLFEPHDYLRLEIEAALNRRVPLIPVLIERVAMPDEPDLPPSIAELARHQAYKLDDQSFKRDADQLVAIVEQRLAPERTEPVPVVTATPDHVVVSASRTRSERARPAWVALGLVVVIVAVAFGADALLHDSAKHASAKHARVVAVVPNVGTQPLGVATVGNQVWVSSEGGVRRIDPNANQVVETIPVGGRLGDMVYGFGALWVIDGDKVERIDPTRPGDVTAIDLGAVAADLATDTTAVWASLDQGGIVFIDPHSRTPQVRLPPGTGKFADIVAGTAGTAGCPQAMVWAAHYKDGGNYVWRSLVDGQEHKVTAGIGVQSIGLAIGFDALWVTNSVPGTITRLGHCGTDPSIIALDPSDAPWGAATGSSGVWIANRKSGSVIRIDPKTNSVTDRVTVGKAPDAIAVDGKGTVWVANSGEQTVSRIELRP